MAPNDKTFGSAISNARKAKGWALKDLAAKVLREDEEPISPQYLNDIEHDRRSPSSDRMVQQFADALGIDHNYLYYLAGRWPKEFRDKLSADRTARRPRSNTATSFGLMEGSLSFAIGRAERGAMIGMVDIPNG